jgi:hypothetical protein
MVSIDSTMKNAIEKYNGVNGKLLLDVFLTSTYLMSVKSNGSLSIIIVLYFDYTSIFAHFLLTIEV